jgi:acetyl esterase/lipase
VLLLVSQVAAAGAIEVPAGYTFDVDVAYGTDSERQRLDVLYPESDSKTFPAVVYIHGGGWYTGSKGGERTFNMLRRFADAGYVVASIEYRLSDEAPFPAAVQDCKRAIQWLRAHAGEYRIDPKRVGVIGVSAGGHLTAMLAVTRPEDGLESEGSNESSAVQAAIPVAAPFELRIPVSMETPDRVAPMVAQFLGGPLGEKADEARRASPVAYAHTQAAPMLIIHGTADKLVHLRQAKAMVAVLKKAQAPHEVLFVEGGKHGMGVALEAASFEKVLTFLATHL